MNSRFAALLLPLTFVACSPKGDGTDSGTDTSTDTSTGTSTDTSITGTSITGTSITDASTDSGTDSSTGTSSSGGEELPAPSEVCPAFCDKLKSCADEPAMFDVAECIVECEGTISFLDMNNPGAGCGDAYIGVTECLSESTCEQIDAYYEFEDAMRPCMDWDDTLNNCAIE